MSAIANVGLTSTNGEENGLFHIFTMCHRLNGSREYMRKSNNRTDDIPEQYLSIKHQENQIGIWTTALSNSGAVSEDQWFDSFFS